MLQRAVHAHAGRRQACRRPAVGEFQDRLQGRCPEAPSQLLLQADAAHFPRSELLCAQLQPLLAVQAKQGAHQQIGIAQVGEGDMGDQETLFMASVLDMLQDQAAR
ncbi:MAG: hypothetical protein V3T83_03240, partial [Acidobacteriota bacterium]